MKYIGLLFFLIGVVLCVDDQYADHEIEQLCPSAPTVECLREVFSDRGNVAPATGDVSEASYEDTNVPYVLPAFDMTVVLTDYTFSNLDGGRIEKAYFDKTNSKYLISVFFDTIACDAKNAIFAFDKPLSEPIVIVEDIFAEYHDMQIDAIIPAQPDGTLDDESFKQGTYTGIFLGEGSPNFVFGPKIINSQDLIVQTVLGKLQADPSTTVKEIFASKAASYFASWFSNQISDFPSLTPDFQRWINPAVLYNIAERQVASPSLNHYCEPENMRDCISEFHLANGDGVEVGEVTDEPVFRPGAFIQTVPSLLSFAQTIDAKLTVDGEIVEFYKNEDTNNLVMCVKLESPGITMKSPRVIVSIWQRGQQPRVYEEANSDVYPGTLCIVTSLDNGLTAQALKESYVSFDFGDNLPTFKFTPISGNENDDGDAQEVIHNFENNLLVGQEIMRTEKKFNAIAFIQKYIADYGIPFNSDLENYSY